MKTSTKSRVLYVTIAILFGFYLQAQTDLTAGDIAFTGFHSDGPDDFSFLTLTNISSGTTVKFTDNGWMASGGFRFGEGILEATFTTDVPCGTEIYAYTGPGTKTLQVEGVEVGSIVILVFNYGLSVNGDQIFAYQGSDGNPTFLAGVNFNGTLGWDADAVDNTTSALPASLTEGVNAVGLTDLDNNAYVCVTITGTKDQVRSALNTAGNWVGSNDRNEVQVPTGCDFNPTDCRSSSPVALPRSPGEWKNWSSCTKGNQFEMAAANGGCEEGYCTLDDIINYGILWCMGTSEEFAISSCEVAVDILDMRDIASGRKRANDPAYALARNLLAAQANFAAGAESCQEATDAAIAAEELLCELGFDGTGNYLRSRDALYSQARDLAEILDAYNNGCLCGTADPDYCDGFNLDVQAEVDLHDSYHSPLLFSDGNATLSVYPNPSPDYYYLDLAGLEEQTISIQLHDNMGRIVLEQEASYVSDHPIRIQVTGSVVSGLYYIRIKHQTGFMVQPVLLGNSQLDVRQ